jgi:hypothetical protein
LYSGIRRVLQSSEKCHETKISVLGTASSDWIEQEGAVSWKLQQLQNCFISLWQKFPRKRICNLNQTK